MDLERLYELQKKLDHHILENNNIEMSKEELLDNTILALLVEVGELANTTRCFKHWSKKGMMGKEVVLDELADVIHFYLSIGNQINIRLTEKDTVIKDMIEISKENNMTSIFSYLYTVISTLDGFGYKYTGNWLQILSYKLGFTDEEVEQAYLKKHEENYKRQREGY